MPPRELIGIDGWRGGWVVAASDAELSALASRRQQGLVEPKRTAAGERVRLRLLRRAAPRFDPAAVRARLGGAQVARDDVVDAVACLVAARRIAEGKALVLPVGGVERDTRGLRMEIVA